MIKVIHKVDEMKKIVAEMISLKKQIGFVPTMGYLHEGHLSLVRKSKCNNDITIASIFVNPIQFGKNEDYDKYPRDYDRDLQLLDNEGVDILFMPEIKEMYPDGYATYIDVEYLTKGLCGASRPGHFRGVCTVVAKLFNICRPNSTYLGQKDFQQCAVLKKMAQDLNFGTKIIICPTVRDADGLALSSRNTYLSQDERKAAPLLYKALQEAMSRYTSGERNTDVLLMASKNILKTEPLISIEYIEAVNRNELTAVSMADDDTVIAAAIRLGRTRLIDNILLGGI